VCTLVDRKPSSDTSQQFDAKHYWHFVTLRSGQSAIIRAIVPADKYVLREGMHHLAAQSRYFRFLTPKEELTDDEVAYFTEIDFLQHVALMVFIIDENGTEVPAGVGRYIVTPGANPTSAELAFTVVEEFQGLGVGKMLLQHLTIIARAAGIARFTALVLPDNVKMLKVFEHSELKLTKHMNVVGVLEITLDL
jgi:GNAT superfamily N-acetyltransferase